jgi:hypothetical protein
MQLPILEQAADLIRDLLQLLLLVMLLLLLLAHQGERTIVVLKPLFAHALQAQLFAIQFVLSIALSTDC